MIQIFVQGGIGNQMFQYALYTSLQKRGKRVLLDNSIIEKQMNDINRQTIFHVFELDRQYHLRMYRGLFGQIRRRVINRVFRKLAGRYAEKEDSKFDPNVLQLSSGYLTGYWQSPKYFSDCEAELRKRFQFKKALSAGSEKVLSLIENASCPVSIHIRLGDYTTAVNQELFGNICTKEYYSKAIDRILEHNPDATFFVFSNEPQKATELIDIPNAIIVDANDEGTASEDMYLMSKCHHNIIANSSFSWWGAWLNENPGKITIAPKKWLNGKNTPDICPESWIRI